MSDDLRILGRAIRRELEHPWICPGCGRWKSERAERCFSCQEVARDVRERREAAQ